MTPLLVENVLVTVVCTPAVVVLCAVIVCGLAPSLSAVVSKAIENDAPAGLRILIPSTSTCVEVEAGQVPVILIVPVTPVAPLAGLVIATLGATALPVQLPQVL